MPLAGWLDERVGSARIALVALLGGGSSLWLAGVAGSLGALVGALALFGAGVRRRQRCRQRARHRPRARVRPIDPVLVPCGVQRRRADRRRRGWSRRRHAALSLRRTSRRSPSRSRSSRSARAVSSRAPMRAARRSLSCAPARTVRCWVAPHSSRCSPRAQPPTGAPSTSADRSAPSAAFAALGYTAFSLAMVASRLAGDRLDEAIGPAAPPVAAAWSPPSGSPRRSRSARRPPRSWASPPWCGPRGDGPVIFRTPGRRRASRRDRDRGRLDHRVPRVPRSPPAIHRRRHYRSSLRSQACRGQRARCRSLVAGDRRRHRPFRGSSSSPCSALRPGRRARLLGRRHLAHLACVRRPPRPLLGRGRRGRPRPPEHRSDPARGSAPRRRGRGGERRARGDRTGIRPAAPPGRAGARGRRAGREFAIVTSGSRALALARLRAPASRPRCPRHRREWTTQAAPCRTCAAELLGVDPAHSVVLETPGVSSRTRR